MVSVNAPPPPRPSSGRSRPTRPQSQRKVGFRAAVTKATGASKESAAAASTVGESRIIDAYNLVEHVHTSSTFGTEVHVARHRSTNELVVLKAVERSHSRPVSMTAAAALHARLEHEHIARLHEVFDSERLVLVLEMVEGITLDIFMQSFGCRPDDAT